LRDALLSLRHPGFFLGKINQGGEFKEDLPKPFKGHPICQREDFAPKERGKFKKKEFGP